MKISRKDFLSSAASATAGAALGVLGHRELTKDPPRLSAIVLPVSPSPAPEAESTPAHEPELRRETYGENFLAKSAVIDVKESFAQSGEDLIVVFIFRYLGIGKVTYLDIGAFDPIRLSNTYLLYKMGFRGVLVEPNVTMCERLREVRPRDTTLAAGIGVTAAREADYYVMTDPSWNTFSKEEAEHQAKETAGMVAIREVIKMPLLNINDVMSEHFDGAPAFVSIDAEGLHLAIVKSLDFHRFRPKVVCIETLVSGTKRTIPEIPRFLESQGYVVRGETFPNTIFVNSQLLR